MANDQLETTTDLVLPELDGAALKRLVSSIAVSLKHIADDLEAKNAKAPATPAPAPKD